MELVFLQPFPQPPSQPGQSLLLMAPVRKESWWIAKREPHSFLGEAAQIHLAAVSPGQGQVHSEGRSVCPVTVKPHACPELGVPAFSCVPVLSCVTLAAWFRHWAAQQVPLSSGHT